MKTFLEKLSRFWQLRLVAMGAGVLLIAYAVLLPDSGSDSSDISTRSIGSIESVAAAPLTPATLKRGLGSSGLAVSGDAALDRASSSDLHTSDARSQDTGIPWLGMNQAVADQLEIPVRATEESELPRDFSESIRRLQNAAKHGNPTAQFLLGHAYESGLGVPKDMNETIHWYARATGIPAGSTGDGSSIAGTRSEKDFAQAFESCRAAAEKGDASAQLYLGLAYDLGRDVPRDSVEAARWYRMAEAAGSASAASNLGVLYHNGDGTVKDSVAAAKWFQESASRGSASGQYSLGRMYYEGDGVPLNYVEAGKWLEKSASQGNPSAQILLSYLYATGRGVQGSTPLAYMWINLASANENLARLARTRIEKVAPSNEIEAGQQLPHEWLTHHPQLI
jgi:TPR repeat protein